MISHRVKVFTHHCRPRLASSVRSVCPAASLAPNRRSEKFYLPQEEAVIVVNVNRLDEDNASKSTEIFMGISKILYTD